MTYNTACALCHFYYLVSYTASIVIDSKLWQWHFWLGVKGVVSMMIVALLKEGVVSGLATNVKTCSVNISGFLTLSLLKSQVYNLWKAALIIKDAEYPMGLCSDKVYACLVVSEDQFFPVDLLSNVLFLQTHAERECAVMFLNVELILIIKYCTVLISTAQKFGVSEIFVFHFALN